MKLILTFVCALLAAGTAAAQEMTPPKYNGADVKYYMGRLVGETMKIVDEESVPAGELSPEVIARCTIDTAGNTGGWLFLDNTSEGADHRDIEPATVRTQELIARAAERLGSWIPAARDEKPVPYVMTMRLRIPVEKIAKKQETDPLLFLGQDPDKVFHDWARVRIRTLDEKVADRNDQIAVHVRFYIEPDGRITGVEVVKADNKKLAKETVRVVKSSKGKWTPRKVRGVPQRTAYEYRFYRFYE